MPSSIIHESEGFVPPLRGEDKTVLKNLTEQRTEENSFVVTACQRLAKPVLDYSICLSLGPLQIATTVSWPEI